MKKIAGLTLLLAVTTAFAGCDAFNKTIPTEKTSETETTIVSDSSDVTESSEESREYTTAAPAGSDFSNELLTVMTSYHNGELGYLLKSAEGMYEMVMFVDEHDMSDVDPEEAAANFQAELDNLSKQDLATFVINYRFAKDKMDEMLRDKRHIKPFFNDIGYGDEMDALLNKNDVVEGWENLCTVIDSLTSDIEVDNADMGEV